MSKLNVNQPVKFNAFGGSVGRIIETLPNGWHHVKWCYGLDAYEEPITAISYYIKPENLINIDEKKYAKYINCRAWGTEQKALDKEFDQLVFGAQFT